MLLECSVYLAVQVTNLTFHFVFNCRDLTKGPLHPMFLDIRKERIQLPYTWKNNFRKSTITWWGQALFSNKHAYKSWKNVMSSWLLQWVNTFVLTYWLRLTITGLHFLEESGTVCSHSLFLYFVSFQLTKAFILFWPLLIF